MKPFNLEEALAGKPVVTRNGKRVSSLTIDSSCTHYPLTASIENQPYISFNSEGSYVQYMQHDYDLFMAEEKIETCNKCKEPIVDGDKHPYCVPEITTPLEPFNLEEALAGKPVVTRNGKKVIEISTDGADQFPIIGRIEDCVFSFTHEGKFYNYGYDDRHPLDLFMTKIPIVTIDIKDLKIDRLKRKLAEKNNKIKGLEDEIIRLKVNIADERIANRNTIYKIKGYLNEKE